jgi:hypothetical protein
MDVEKILAEMRQEREQLEEAIANLERLARPVKRRGRPPAWLAGIKKTEEMESRAAGGKKKPPSDSKAPG